MLKFLYLTFILTTIFTRCVGTWDSLGTIREDGIISKMTLKISSTSGLKNILIKNVKELDSINTALKGAKEINVNSGGKHDVWADIYVFKNGKRANFMVQYSKYHGWMIVFGSRTFSSEYIFNLIKRYK